MTVLRELSWERKPEDRANPIDAYHPIRRAWVNDRVLCADVLAQAPLNDVLNLCKRLCTDLPVLLLTSKFTAMDAVVSAGSREQTALDGSRHLRHLELMVMHEFIVHQQVRDVLTAGSHFADFEASQKEYLPESRPTAQVQEARVTESLTPVEVTPVQLPATIVSPEAPGPTVQAKAEIACEPTPALASTAAAAAEAPVPLPAPIALPALAAPGRSKVGGRLDYFDALAVAIAHLGEHALPRAAMVFAVDDFQELELRLGLHDAEEAVNLLQEWLAARLGPQDQLFRFSTSELAAIVDRDDIVGFEQLCERICNDVQEQAFKTAGQDVLLSLTCAAFPLAVGERAAIVVDELIRETRKLSARGGRQFGCVGPTARASEHYLQEERIADQVRKALAESRMKLAHQSIASLEGEARQHFDMLVRMVDETGNEVLAADFIKTAEKFGLIRDIDKWVTGRALEARARLGSDKEDISMFVKLSEQTLREPDEFVAWLKEQVKSLPLQDEEIVFEFQEPVLQRNRAKAIALTAQLRELGASIAIEHFGIGANSRQLLDDIPAQFLKFDASYTKAIDDREVRRRMTNLMEVAKGKGMKSIVSHVEGTGAMARFWQMGLNYAQGFQVRAPEVVQLSSDLVATRKSAAARAR